MKQIIFGIFAHPDDAGFGPSGTLAMAARDGVDVHLVCATCGGAGTNSDRHDNLSDVREREERQAAEIIGVSSLELLRVEDGTLSNNDYLELADKIITHIHTIVAQYNEPCNITLLTFDPNGISGHIDHIVVSLATTYVYLKLRDTLTMQLKYFCIPESFMPRANTGWLYMPKGRTLNEIDETIDVRSVRKAKIAAIKAHQTQKQDADMHLSRGDANFDEHFMFYKD